MNIKRIIRIGLISYLLLANFQIFAQVAGDEDSEMFNRSKARDQTAVDEALNSWWTASMKTHEQRIQWWREAKFGMFVHWGIYSLPAGEWKGKKVSGYAEHLMRKEKISRREYLDLAHLFNPVEFNAEEWIKTAKAAGMRYFIITAKHHDGFAMFNSSVSDFNIMDQTPFKRDPMAELAAACNKYGMKFGFYYSHAFDWEHPDAPGNDWEYPNPGGDKLIGGANWFDNHPEWLPKAVKYVDDKAIPQIKELINKYHPDILWFDTPHKLPFSENLRILKAIRETDPNVVVNGRLARNGNNNYGDYKNTGDRPAEFYPAEGDWEAIPTTNESYGYSKTDNSHKPTSFFVQLLAKSASRGGNLLLNIGPQGDGAMDVKDLQILSGLAKWMSTNGESIYKAGKSELPVQSWGVTTYGNSKLYLHVFNWPSNGKLPIGRITSGLGKAYLLSNVSKLLTVNRLANGDLELNVPKQAPDSMNTVIVLETEDPLKADSIRLVPSDQFQTRLLAFDATLKGGNLKYGDGKSNRYFVSNWKSNEQQVEWAIRTAKTTKFKVLIKYVADKGTEGTYQLQCDKFIYDGTVAAKKGTETLTVEAGILKLGSGIHHLTIKPIEIKQAELMKLLEVQLIPIQ